MKIEPTLAIVAILTSCAFAEMPAKLPELMNPEQLAKWRAETAAENAAKAASESSKLDVRSSTLEVPTPFFTGKPYSESTGTYAFKYRSYNPELARWTTEDPSGFPDGANCFSYVNNSATSFFDVLGFSGKSVLWVTLNNLFGNGYLAPSGFNYMADFNGNYTDLKSELNLLDSQTSGTGTATEYLSDGDLFDKHLVSSSSEFTSIANGYAKVFFITHGGLDNGQYVFLGPDGQYHQMAYFDTFWDSTSIIMLTCGNGYAPPANQGNSSTDPVSWGDAVTDARWQTRNYLYE